MKLELEVRTNVRKAIWRGTAIADLVWLFDRLASSGTHGKSVLGFATVVPAWEMAVATAVLLGLHFSLQNTKAEGCLSLFFFPFYVGFLPILLPLALGANSWTVVSRIVKRSQNVAFSLGIYALSVGSVLLALFAPGHGALLTAAMWCASLATILVLVSTTTWLFNPFSWFYQVLDWPTRIALWGVDRQRAGIGDFLASPSDAASKLNGFMESLRGGQKSLQEPAPFSFENADALLIVGFTRKLVASFVHVSFLLAILAYGVGMHSSVGPAFSSLGTGEFSTEWFSYFFYSLGTMASGETGVLARSDPARLWIIGAKVTSIVFLVILVATFSVLSHERCKRSVQRLADSRRRTLAEIERLILQLLVTGQAANAIDDRARATLLELAPPVELSLGDRQQWLGAIQIEAVIHDLGKKGKVRIAEQVAKIVSGVGADGLLALRTAMCDSAATRETLWEQLRLDSVLARNDLPPV